MSASTIEKNEDGESSDVQKYALNLDDILVEEVGQFGKYQIVTLALAVLPMIFCVVAAGEFIFTTARIPHRCRVQCDGSASDVPHPEFHPDWLLNAINGTSLASFKSCARFAENPVQIPSNETCSADWFDRTTEVNCDDGYVYENTYTIVYDFDMACDEWRRSRVGSIRNFGTILVLPLTGFISDRWGRRVALAINAFNTAWIGLVRSFINSYEWFLALEVIESTVGGGTYSSCYILVMELVGPQYRVLAAAMMLTIVSLSFMTLGFLAWGLLSWRLLTRVIYAPQLIVVTYFWILSESVRWLMSKDRYEEAEAVLKKVAKANKKELSQKSLKALRTSAEAAKYTVKKQEPWLPLLVFKSPAILSRCVVSSILWISNTLVYQGMNINAGNLSGNSYLNYVYAAVIEIPGTWTGYFLLDRIGRKPVLIGAYWLCAACQFTFAFMPDGFDTLSMLTYLLGKYFIGMLLMSGYIYTAEIYPTKYRHTLFAFSSMVGRLGALAAPLTPALAQEVWESLPSVMFGSLALLSGLLVFTLPETLGTKLPDTMKQAEELSTKK